MTEREAWAALARGVESGEFPNGLCAALGSVCGAQSCGICKERVIGRLAPQTLRRMLERIDDFPPHRAFRWPLTKKGQKARAAYCRRQVARLTPKRKPAPKRKAKR